MTTARWLRRSALAGCLLFAGACAGPERVPRQPVTGVDRPFPSEEPPPPPSRRTPKAPPPADVSPAPEPEPQARLVGPFVDAIARAVRARPGLVAVFPALSRDGTSGRDQVNALGAGLADTIARSLGQRGLNPLSGQELVNEILAANRGLDSWRSLADVYWLAARIGADYVVFGTVQRVVYDRLAGREHLDIQLQCLRLADRVPVAELRRRLTGGPLARALYRDYRRPSTWRIGAAAPPFRPSVDAEVRLVARTLVRRILAAHAKALQGKRIAVDPTVVEGVSGPRAENLRVLTQSFLEVLTAAERRAAAAGATDPRAAALAHGPVLLHGKEYRNLRAVLQTIRARRAVLEGSRAGRLSVDLARLLAEEFRRAGGETLVLQPDRESRRAILELLEREARLYRETGAIEPSSIASLKARGAEILVQSTLRPFMRSYQFRLIVLDIRTGRVIAQASQDLEARFKEELDRLTAG